MRLCLSHRELATVMLKSGRSVADVTAMLNRNVRGVAITYNSVDAVRRQLVKSRAIQPRPDRKIVAKPAEAPLLGEVAVEREVATTACDALLSAIDGLYQRTAERRGCSIGAARLLLNYSPAQIERMAGA